MLKPETIKTWSWWHKWSSLICTAFLLLLCLTGLPLIFHHEIEHVSGHEIEAPHGIPDHPRASLDTVLRNANALYPSRIVQFVSQPIDDDKLWHVTLTPSPAPTNDFKSIAVDARTGEVLGEVPVNSGFMNIVLRLHVDLFAGLFGKLFLGAMGFLFAIAIVSGVVLYAPFMRKRNFGDIRKKRSKRTQWLDIHNLAGIVTLTWALVVGLTGAINTGADLLMAHWKKTDLQAVLSNYKGKAVVSPLQTGSVQKGLELAQATNPKTRVAFIAFPGTSFSSPLHHTFYLRGSSPLTSRLLQPVLVNTLSNETTEPDMPWYLHALLLSQPLHFGDYGGMPMKILWALLDLATIAVLGSGLYLWIKKL